MEVAGLIEIKANSANQLELELELGINSLEILVRMKEWWIKQKYCKAIFKLKLELKLKLSLAIKSCNTFRRNIAVVARSGR